LKDSLEQRSGALKLLVQSEWDRFVGIKGATECTRYTSQFLSLLDTLTFLGSTNYSGICSNEGGSVSTWWGSWSERYTREITSCVSFFPLSLRNQSDHEKDVLIVATSRADAVFQPILDARTKAERLRSTLGVFERSKFFFNLPGVLGEAVESVSRSLNLCHSK
jgi:exocyst complex component 2